MFDKHCQHAEYKDYDKILNYILYEALKFTFYRKTAFNKT